MPGVEIVRILVWMYSTARWGYLSKGCAGGTTKVVAIDIQENSLDPARGQ